MSSDTLFSGTVPVYTFTDNDAIPISIGGGPCELAADGSAQCRQEFVGSFVIDLRDRDDTAQISTGGTSTIGPPRIGALIDRRSWSRRRVGRPGQRHPEGERRSDSLRGRDGADTYKGGRGRDTLQTLDGIRDTFISCGDGNDDFLRKDAIDPRGNHCEHSNHKNPSKP